MLSLPFFICRTPMPEAWLWTNAKLVVDGNMKNHWDLCLATNAGCSEYKGLPGRVQTGCPNSPDYKSYFCQLHKPNVAKWQNIQVTDESCTSEVPKESAITCRDTVGFTIGKRVTRSSTLYQFYANKTVELLYSRPLKWGPLCSGYLILVPRCLR